MQTMNLFTMPEITFSGHSRSQGRRQCHPSLDHLDFLSETAEESYLLSDI